MRYQQNVVIAGILILVSEFLFASMGAIVKHVSVNMPNEMLVFMRNMFGLLVIIPFFWGNNLSAFSTRVLHLHILRALLGVSAMYCFFYALAHLPLANGVLLKMTTPLFLPLIALWWLNEKFHWKVIPAVITGFIGVIIIIRPDQGWNTVAMIGLLGGLLASIAKVTVRKLGHTESTRVTVFYFALISTLVSCVPLAWAWQQPEAGQWGWLIGMGVLGTIAQLSLTRAYAMAAPARIGSLTYFSVVFAALYGYLVWNEGLDILFLTGAILIAVSGIIALRSKMNVKPATSKQFETEPV